MKLSEINPHLRFAADINYCSPKGNPVRSTDCRIFYVHSGHCEIFIENKHYHLSPDSMFYSCGGSEYNIIAADTVSIFSLNFDLTQQNNTIKFHIPLINLPASRQKTSVFFDYVEDSSILNSHICFGNGSAFLPRIRQILSEFTNQGILFRELCSGILKELLIELHRNQSTNSTRINAVISYIDLHYAEDLTNQTLAELAGYHEYHLNRLFQSYTGTTIHNYILRIRLKHASRLILNTDLPLNIISDQIGFNSYSHFSTYFKQFFGFAPTEYRKRLKNRL